MTFLEIISFSTKQILSCSNNTQIQLNLVFFFFFSEFEFQKAFASEKP
jgi:hypothetical protein